MSALTDLLTKYKDGREAMSHLEILIVNAWFADETDVDKAAAELAALQRPPTPIQITLEELE
jgi:hypothetical protein